MSSSFVSTMRDLHSCCRSPVSIHPRTSYRGAPTVNPPLLRQRLDGGDGSVVLEGNEIQQQLSLAVRLPARDLFDYRPVFPRLAEQIEAVQHGLAVARNVKDALELDPNAFAQAWRAAAIQGYGRMVQLALPQS